MSKLCVKSLLFTRIMSEQSLKNKTIKGTLWSAMENVTKMGVTFVVSIILARLLSPEEYGLIGILTIFIALFNAIVDSGFTNALIRKQDATDTDYSTVFYTNLVMSLFLATVLFLCSYPIAAFFERPELVVLTKVMSSVVVINAFAIVQRARTTKAIDFKTQTKITFISSIGSGAIGITLAYMNYGVWALVGQQISNQLISTVFFWLYNRWMPKLVFSWASFKEMWAFGSKLLASGLIDTAWKEVYQVVIGKCYSPATLGLYTPLYDGASDGPVFERRHYSILCPKKQGVFRKKSEQIVTNYFPPPRGRRYFPKRLDRARDLWYHIREYGKIPFPKGTDV